MSDRRSFLRGIAALPIAMALPAMAGPAFHHNDARLVALADSYKDLDRELGALPENAPSIKSLLNRCDDLESEMALTPADSLTGVLAKARHYQNRTARETADPDQLLSLADDLHRLFGGAAGVPLAGDAL